MQSLESNFTSFNYGTVYTREIGNVTVKVKADYDECPDYSWLGEFCDAQGRNHGRDLNEPYLYHRGTDTLRGPDGYWRNRKGQIQAEPEEYSSRDYEFIACGSNYDGCKEARAYCFQDCDRLVRMGTDWEYLVVSAHVYLHGKKIGWATCGSVDSDDPQHLAEIAKECMDEAIAEAKAFTLKICKAN